MDGRSSSRRARVVASRFGALLVSVTVLSCGDMPTAPRDPTPPLVFETRLPRALAEAGAEVAQQLVPFDHVRITFRRLTGRVALDTTFAMQPEFDSVAVKLNIPLQLSLPLLGETMTLVVTCLNDQGAAVYRGGPTVISVHPGTSSSPVVIQLAYVGAGSVASTIQIIPDALSVLIGAPFSFTATVFDAGGIPITDAPVVWSVLEPTLATLTSPLGGVGAALTTGGVAHIIAQVPDGPADTATVTIGLPLPIASTLQLVSSLTTAIAGTALGSITVKALDDAGQLVTSFTNAVTIALGDNPGGATLSGTQTVTAVAGVATFSDLSLDKVASGYTLVASAAGLPSGTSSAFSITHAAASILSIVGGNNQTSLVGLLLGSPLTAKVTDAFGNPVPGVPVAWSVLAGGGLLGNASTQTNASGIASNTWTLGLLAGLQSVTATVSGLTGSPLTYDATATLLAPVATKLLISTVAATATAGAVLAPIVASAADAAGQLVSGFAGTVTIALSGGPSGVTLNGTRTVQTVNGVATFNDLSLNKAASGYSLVATTAGLTSATSNTFSVTHAAASLLAIAGGNNQTGLVSALLGSPLTAKVTDPFDNPVSGVSVAWSVVAGAGLLGNASTQTDASGIASNTWTLGLLAGVQRISAAASGLTGSPLTYSATATALAPVATKLVISALQSSAVAGTALTGVVVSATDDAGAVVTTFANNIAISLGANPGGAALSGTQTVRAANGVATFSDLSLDKVANGYTLTAAASGLASATSGGFSITHAVASILSIAGGNNQTSLVGVLLGAPLTAKVTDAFGNPVPGVNVAWSVFAGGGLLGNASTQTNASGIASNTWTLGLLTGLQSVTASVNGLTGSPLTYSATGTLLPGATKLVISALQSSAIAGSAITGVVVSATDDAGEVVTTFANNISISLGSNPGGATLSGTQTVRAVNGVATFGDLSLDKVGSGYTLAAASAGLTGATSSAFSITHAAASILAIVGGNDQTGFVSALLGAPLTVKVTDAFNNVVSGASVAWAVTLGGGLLSNVSTTTNSTGVASANWTLGLLAGVQRATATVSGLTGSPATFTATATALPPVATTLEMSAVQATAVAGTLLSVVVTATDDAGQSVTDFSGDVTVALGANPGGAVLNGTRTVRAANGIATFGNLSINNVASGYTLVATSTGLVNATSNAFSITHAAASLLAVVGGDNQTAVVGALLATPLAVRITDAFSNPVPGATVAWDAILGGGILGSATSQTNASGVASSTWTLGSLAGAQKATATATGLTGSPATFTATATALAPVATKLAMSTLQSTAVAGTALSSITVRATDDAGTLVTSFAGDITMALSANPGGGTLSGTRTVRAVNGVATFDDLSLDKAAGGYTFVASSAGLSNSVSGPLTITHAVAAILSIVGGDNQSGLLSGLLGTPLSVLVTDAFANPVPGASVAWAVTLGGGLLGSATSQTNASGVATNTWTLGLLAGLQHASASVGGLSGSPATFSATGLLGIVEQSGNRIFD